MNNNVVVHHLKTIATMQTITQHNLQMFTIPLIILMLVNLQNPQILAIHHQHRHNNVHVIRIIQMLHIPIRLHQNVVVIIVHMALHHR